MITFTDAEGSKIFVNKEDIKVVVIASPLNPASKNMICMVGVTSIVTNDTAKSVLQQLGESVLVH